MYNMKVLRHGSILLTRSIGHGFKMKPKPCFYDEDRVPVEEANKVEVPYGERNMNMEKEWFVSQIADTFEKYPVIIAFHMNYFHRAVYEYVYPSIGNPGIPLYHDSPIP